jgi:hypothetical protein
MLRPKNLKILWTEKSPGELAKEREKHKALADQLSLFDSTAKPLEPSSVQFVVRWWDKEGKERNHECDDWETSAAFNRFEQNYGRKKAIEILQRKYEDEYFKAGLALAFSTHSRRNVHFGTKNQWLLVGLIRVDFDSQGDFLL